MINQRSNDGGRPPIVTRDYRDFLTPGAMVELSPAEAEDLGCQEETAITESEAWESQLDAVAEYDGNEEDHHARR